MTHSNPTLQQLGEFGLIERIKQLLPPAPPSVFVGVGDDAAVWQPTTGKALTLTCDCAVEGRHFPKLKGQSLAFIEQMGRRAVHMNLSDIASMAADPRFALVGLALPSNRTVESIEALYRGIVQAFTEFDVTVVGGNITSTSGPLLFHITLGGEVTPNLAVLRTGSQPGDHIGVTGFPGNSAAGLHCWLSETPLPSGTESLLDAYLQPNARVKEGLCLAPYVHAMTDISDGLLLDLQNLLVPEHLGAVLHQKKLPLHPSMKTLTQHLKQPSHQFTFAASDDYELLFTAPPHAIPALEQAYYALPNVPPLHWIGTVTESSGLVLANDETKTPLTIQGWEHFQNAQRAITPS